MIYKFRDIIEEVEERNTDLRYGLDNIVGVTIEKGLIPTIANLTQTSLDKFYLVKPGTFVYNPRTHGVRLGMGFNNTTNIYITSWNNVAFKVSPKAQDIVMPQYLWLFFCRPIWDRLTNFLAWGSSTIVFAWKDFLDIDIDIPSITRQREIVSQYETLTNRIRLNNQVIQHLEATAQALYRKTFVDNIDKENLPEGWRMGTIDNICEVKDGTHDSPKPIDVGNPLITSVHLKPWSVSLESAYFISAKDYSKINERSLVEKGDILMSMIGTIGIVSYVLYEQVVFAVKNMAIFKTSQNSEYVEYVLFYLKSNELKQYIVESTSGSTQGYVTLNTLRCMPIIIPDEYIIKEYHCITKELISHIWNLTKEDLKLTELQSLLLAKMGQ